MISKFNIHNFKGMHSGDVPLNKMNILIGANNSGKSSILEALNLTLGSLKNYRTENSSFIPTSPSIERQYIPYSLHHIPVKHLEYTPENDEQHLIDIQERDNKYKKLVLIYLDQFEYPSMCEYPNSQTIHISRSDCSHYLAAQTHYCSYISQPIPATIGTEFEEMFNLQIIPTTIATYIQRVVQQYGNIDVLHEMLNKLYPEYLIQGSSGSFIPSIGNEQIIHIYDKNNEQTYALTMMGRGFLQALQIICNYLLFKPKLMLLDEVDTPFHAGIQKRLFDLLCSWDTQIIWVTHSRSLLEHIIDNKNDTTSLYITKYNPTKQVNTIYGTNADKSILTIWELLGEVSFDLFILSEDTNLLIKKIYGNNRLNCKIGFQSFHGGDNYGELVNQIRIIRPLWNCPILIHLDGDKKQDKEKVKKEIKQFTKVDLWYTNHRELEGYILEPTNLKSYLSKALPNIDEDIRNQQLKIFFDEEIIEIIRSKYISKKYQYTVNEVEEEISKYKSKSWENKIDDYILSQDKNNEIKPKDIFNRLKNFMKINNDSSALQKVYIKYIDEKIDETRKKAIPNV